MTTAKLTTGLGPGQWVEQPAAKPAQTLGRRLVDAVGKERKLAEVTAKVEAIERDGLDLTDHTVDVLIGNLEHQVAQRLALISALKAKRDGGTE